MVGVTSTTRPGFPSFSDVQGSPVTRGTSRHVPSYVYHSNSSCWPLWVEGLREPGLPKD